MNKAGSCVHAPPPTWTAIEGVRLIPDGGISEIEIVAKLPAAIH